MRQLGLRLGKGQLDSRQVYGGQVEASRVGLDDGGGAPLHQVLALPAQQLSQELPLCRVQSWQLTAVPGQSTHHCHLTAGSVLPLFPGTQELYEDWREGIVGHDRVRFIHIIQEYYGRQSLTCFTANIKHQPSARS